MINQQFRAAVWAMIAAFGLTILLIVADPEPNRRRILAARELPAPRGDGTRLADAARTPRTAGAPELSLEPAPSQAPESPLGIDPFDGPFPPRTPRFADRGASRAADVAALPTRGGAPRHDDYRLDDRPFLDHQGDDARGDLAAPSAEAPNPRRRPPEGVRLGPLVEELDPPPQSPDPLARLQPPVPHPGSESVRESWLPLLEPPDPRSDRRSITFEPLEVPGAGVTHAETRGLAPVPAATAEMRSAHPVEARLAGLERDIERLAQQKSGDDALRRATDLLQQLEQRSRLQDLERKLEQFQSPGGASRSNDTNERGATAQAGPDRVPGLQPLRPVPVEPTSTAISPGPPTASPPPSGKAPLVRLERSSNGGERFSLQISDAEIGQVLEMLGEMAGKNILATPAVAGIVSANLIEVTVDEALAGILRARGFAHEQDERFIYVMTQAEFAARRAAERKLITKVYRPNYISTFDLQALVLPLLTPEIGKVAITLPNEAGVPSDNEQAGGDRLSQQDALLVQDYPEVIQTIDGVFHEMDIPPAQVVIEAMILSVRLTDQMQFGVNFALLNGSSDNLVLSGNGNVLQNGAGFPGGGNDSIIPPLGQFVANTAGLKYGFVAGDITGFLDALENITDTNLIAAPQLRVLNKQRAQLIIGQRLSYTTSTFNNNQTIENVNFLDAGTKLIIRPFVAPDGLIRMEIHPERSSATINPQTNLPDLDTTEVTTNVMVRDSTTVIIGGLIEETTVASYDQIPFLGSLPIAGHLFRSKNERVDRNELIVLITPRIVREPEAAEMGAAAAVENQHRHEHFTNNLSPINRQNLARLHYERAVYYLDCGELERAANHIDSSLRLAKNNLQAHRLKARIDEAQRARMRPWEERPAEAPPIDAPPLLPYDGPAPSGSPPVNGPHVPPPQPHLQSRTAPGSGPPPRPLSTAQPRPRLQPAPRQSAAPTAGRSSRTPESKHTGVWPATFQK